MIGALPQYITVKGIEYPINADFRNCLTIIQAFMDNSLTDEEKAYIMYARLFVEDKPDYSEEAISEIMNFLDGGKANIGSDDNADNIKLYDWEQDEQMIFSAINKVAGKEIRAVDYMHFWTFLGLFNEIGDGMFSTVVSIRKKRKKGKKLDDWEREFYKNNKSIVDFEKQERTEEEQSAINRLLGKE